MSHIYPRRPLEDMADTPPPSYPSSEPRTRSPPLPSSSGASKATNGPIPRRRSLPFVFPPLFPKDTSSTFLIPSTAEGRPIPLDGSTAAHRTTALRQLSRSQPSSRHRYTRTSSPPSIKSTTTGTYSQPVVVRTYSGVPPSSAARSSASILPMSNPSCQRSSRNGTVTSMKHHKGNEKGRAAADAKLPPLESFTFKSIMADIQQDVGADLDRIAEICARSRYSLSNQYEVHIAPQGSGAGFLGPPSTLRHQTLNGPTLQAVSSDDEHIGPMQKKRRNITRRRSVAYGTLETIMSSSRSSDEDKSKKKPAAEIVEEVRGRAAMGVKDESASAASTEAQASSDQQGHLPPRSALFATAMIDTSRSQMQGHPVSSRSLGAVLLSGPARPQTSRNHLQIKTSPNVSNVQYYAREPAPRPSQAVARESAAAVTTAAQEEPKASSGLLSSFSDWIPWGKGPVSQATSLDPGKLRSYSYAEGTLKELLKSAKPYGNLKLKDNNLTK
ncbi:hypothetical protein F4677DRAFT_416653 [Hypoxylon crocopeplum]|nr:hypothetical protein F4677DRAFT_416653 [Hypoxylon crocopeplum]